MVIKSGKLDEEPQGEEETTKPSKTPYSSIKDDITEKDLRDPDVAKVVAKTLLGEVKRCQREILELKDFKDRYYDAKQSAAVLQERLSGLRESITVRSLFFTIGGLLGGFLFIPAFSKYLWAIGILCVVCFGLAMLNPFEKRKNNP